MSADAYPVQGGLSGIAADRPTYRPENAPDEAQGALFGSLAPEARPMVEQAHCAVEAYEHEGPLRACKCGERFCTLHGREHRT